MSQDRQTDREPQRRHFCSMLNAQTGRIKISWGSIRVKKKEESVLGD